MIGKGILGERQLENVDCLVVARAALLERQARSSEEPSMAASQAAFQTAIGENIGLSDHAR